MTAVDASSLLEPAPAGTSQVLIQLISSVQAGDHSAFVELYTLTHVHVTNQIARVVRAPDHTAEVVQELYLHVWQNAHTFDTGKGTVLGWLSMLAYRRAVDRVRSVTRAVVRDHRSSVEGQQATVPDIADLAIAHAEAAGLRRAMTRLSVKQREAVTLTYLGGYSHQEAALALRVPLGTLKTRVRDGVSSLRSQLDALPDLLTPSCAPGRASSR